MTTKKRSKRPSKYKVKPLENFKDTLNLNLNHIARELEAAKANNGGKIPYGAITAMVHKMKPVLPWLTKDMIQHRLRKLNEEEGGMIGLVDSCDHYRISSHAGQQISSAYSTSMTTDGTLSTLTHDSANNNTEDNILQPRRLLTTKAPDHHITMIQQRHRHHHHERGDNNHEEDKDSEFMVAEEENTTGDNHCIDTAGSTPTCNRDLVGRVMIVEPSHTEEESASSIPTNKSFGRPKGTTMIYSRDLKERIRLATKEAATKYTDVREKAKLANKRAERGKLTKIVADVKQKYGIIDADISIYTVRTRAKRNKLNPDVSQGTPSPMLVIEPCIIDLITQLSRMRAPINVATGLQLANSLIVGTQFEAKLRAWKEKHNVHARMSNVDDDAGGNLLGWGYWRGFMKRNGHLIKSKKAVKFESKRADWCTHHNFSIMYREVYEEMVKGGIATKQPDEIFLNSNGDPTDENSASGLPTKYVMQHPEKLIFVDEVGSNTSTTKDGNVGGEKFLCEADARPQMKAATKDSHFTVLGFTTATGVPLMCSIIFSAKELDEKWVFGFDASAPWAVDDDSMIGNSGGLGKPFPMGPVCNLNGIKVPTFCCASENGSITGDLLVKMLAAIDKLGVFDRSDGVPPFLLLDGHGSRFDLKFLQYINTDNTKWNVCIGVPYGTSYWQVGDSTEQNGCFKMALTKHKRNLLTRKEECRLEFAIEKVDVVYLVHQAWLDSFARVQSNKKAIAERGWNPLTYNCLLHPEILATKYKDHAANGNVTDEQSQEISQELSSISTSLIPLSSTIITNDLNLSRGLAGTLIDVIVETRMRDDARNGVNLEEIRRKQIQTALDALEKGKRITAGNLVASGSHALSGADVLKNVTEREWRKEEKECEKVRKKIREFKTLQSKVSDIRALNKTHKQMTVSELRTMISWYKLPTDASAPTTRQALLTRLQEICDRHEPKEPIPYFARQERTEQMRVTEVSEL